MKLLLDQGIARSVAPLLNDAGQDAVHVGAVGMSAATDEQIIALARIQGRVVVTLDADFHNMLALTGATGPSTIRIRSEGLRSPSMTALILETIAASGVALLAGAMVTTDGRRVRVRHLPIRSGGK